MRDPEDFTSSLKVKTLRSVQDGVFIIDRSTLGEPPRKRRRTAQDSADVDEREIAETHDWQKPLEAYLDFGADMGGEGYGETD